MHYRLIMKNTLLALVGSLSLTTLLVAGCSSTPSSNSEKMAYAPSVINPRSSLPVVAVGSDLKPAQTPEILADVKDFGSDITDVKLRLSLSSDTPENMRYLRGPIDVPMEHVQGTTWRAKLSDEQIKQLAINGQSMHYEGKVIAKNDKGLVAFSQTPVDLTVQTAPIPSGQSG